MVFHRFETFSPGLKHPKAYFNWLRANYEMQRRSGRIKARPLKITFDPTNVCQLRCPLCPTGLQIQNRETSRAKLDIFEKLMDEVGDYVFFVDLYNWGEPLLNTRLTDFIEVASRKRVSTRISTNLSMRLSDDKLRALISSGLNHMIVSLDGASRETAGSYRRKGDFDLVVENMRRIVRLKRELGSRTPYLIWRFLVFRFNEHELTYAAQLASEIGVDRFTIAPAILDEGDYDIPEDDRELMKTWVPTDPRLTHYDPTEAADVEPGKLRKKGRPGRMSSRCDWHYTTTAINADGAVAPCCALFEKKDDFGKITASEGGGYMNVVNNSKFVAIRNHFSGRSPQPTGLVCEQCPAPNIMNYAKALNRSIILVTVASILYWVGSPFRFLFRRFTSPGPDQTAIDSPVPLSDVKVAKSSSQFVGSPP
jgi:MoaA/NifB/PqqE/SkfB family radical SAM enzyme